MNTPDAFTWRERRLLRSAGRASSRPRWVIRCWYAVLAAFFAWFVWDGVAIWDIDRLAARKEFIEALWFAAVALFATELDASVRLLARLAPVDGMGPRSEPSAGAGHGEGRESSSLSGPEARRLARAPAYADHLERLRWLLPVLTAVAVASAVAAFIWVDIPRPVDLVVACLTGVSISAAICASALRGWVRLAVALARGRAAAG